MKPTKTYNIREAAAAFLAGKRIEGTTRIGNPFALVDYAIGCKRKYRFRNPKNNAHPSGTNPSFDTPEAALEWVAVTLPHITLTVIDPLPLGTVGTVSLPPAPLVPLGENVTRDGRKARVLCNDRAHDQFKPVFAFIQDSKGREESRSYELNGRYRKNEECPIDLVGHLPPEPRKPREFWINVYHNGRTAHETPESSERSKGGERIECVHVREVLPGQDDEIAELKHWKNEMLTLLEGIPLHEIGKEIPGLTLGDRIGPAILPYILRLKKFIGDLRQPAVSAQVEADAANLLEP